MLPILNVVPLIGRVLLAVLFLLSGAQKISAPAGTIAYITTAGLPLPSVAYAVAVAVEVLGGVLLVLGYRSRWVALAMAVFTLVAGLGFHLHPGDQMQMVNFLKNLSIAGGLLQVVAFGAGAWSLDARAGRTRG